MQSLNSLKRITLAAALLAAALMGSAATSATVNLALGGDATGSGSPTGSFSSGDVSGTITAGCGYTGADVNCTGTGGFPITTPTITTSLLGMGVSSYNDTSDQLDITNNGEFLTFAFDQAVDISSIDFAALSITNAYDLLVNGVLVASGSSADPWSTLLTDVLTLTIAATSGTTALTGCITACTDGGFVVSSITADIAAVPLPAAGLLLLGALGGLGLARRRRG